MAASAPEAELAESQAGSLARIAVPAPFAPGGTVNAYVLADERPSVVDPGPNLPAARAALDAGLRQLGWSIGDVGQVIVTHGHVDHVGLAPWLAQAAAAPLRAHPATVADLLSWPAAWQRRTAHLRWAATAAGVPAPVLEAALALAGSRSEIVAGTARAALQPLRHGETLPLGGRSWRIIYTPGHAPDHLCLHNLSQQALLVGDLLLRDTSTAPVLSPHRAAESATPVLQQLIDSWRATARLPTRIAWPGHGQPIRAYRILVARRLAALRDQLRAARTQVAEGATTVWEIGLGLGLSAAPESVAITVGHAGALAEWLTWRGLTERAVWDGVARYRSPDTRG